MATPPKLAPAAVRDAVAAIVERRDFADDPNRDRLSDDPHDVLEYLYKYGWSGVSVRHRADVIESDILDGIKLALYHYWEWRKAEEWLLTQAEKHELKRKKVGESLGVKTGQGLLDRLDAHRGALGDLAVPNAKLYRSTIGHGTGPKPRSGREVDAEPRARDLNPAMRPPAPTSPRERWLADNRDQLRAIEAVLLEHHELVDETTDREAAESLLSIAADHRDGACTQGTFAQLGWAVEELKVVQAVAALPAAHPLCQSMARFASIAEAYPPS